MRREAADGEHELMVWVESVNPCIFDLIINIIAAGNTNDHHY